MEDIILNLSFWFNYLKETEERGVKSLVGLF